MRIRGFAMNGRFLTQPVTGVQRYGRELLQAIDVALDARPDLRVRLLTPRLGSPTPSLRNIVHEQVGRMQGHAWEQFDLPRHVGDDLLFCPGNTAPCVLLGRARVVVTVHDLSYLYYPEAYSQSFRWFYGMLMPRILHKATAVVTVSESERTSIARHYPGTRNLIAIQNGGLPFDEPPAEPASAAEQTVLYVGSLSLRKNLEGILATAGRLTRTRNVRFVLAGGIPKGLAGDFASATAQSDNRIRFLGQVNDWTELRTQFRRATCFFFPSFYEASPLPPVEAMGCGLPVVASSIPSLLERCGDAAVYCDPNSVDDMVKQLQTVLDDPSLRNSLRERGYRRAAQFTWANCAAKTLGVLTEAAR